MERAKKVATTTNVNVNNMISYLKKRGAAIVNPKTTTSTDTVPKLHPLQQGITCFNAGEFEESIYYFSKATKTSHKIDAYLWRACAQYKLGDFDKSIKDYSKAIKSNPFNDAAYNNRGRAYHHLGDYKKAIDDFTTAIQINPMNDLTFNNRGLAYMELKDYGKAIVDFTHCIQINPNNESAYTNCANAYNNLGRYLKATEFSTKATRINPGNDWAFFLRGQSHYRLKQFKKAELDFTKAISIDVQNAEYYNYRGLCYYKLGEHDKAIEDFSKSIFINKTASEVVQYYNNRAKVYIAQRQFEKSLDDTTQALSLDPNNLSAYCRRSYTYLLLEMIHESWSDCEKAMQIDNVHARLYYIRGCLQLKQQLFREALEDFEHFVRLQHDDQRRDDVQTAHENIQTCLKELAGPLKPIVRRNRLAANYNNDSYNHENQYTSSSIIGMTGNNNTLRIPNKETQGDRPMGRPRASTTTKPTAQRKHEFATVRGSRAISFDSNPQRSFSERQMASARAELETTYRYMQPHQQQERHPPMTRIQKLQSKFLQPSPFMRTEQQQGDSVTGSGKRKSIFSRKSDELSRNSFNRVSAPSTPTRRSLPHIPVDPSDCQNNADEPTLPPVTQPLQASSTETETNATTKTATTSVATTASDSEQQSELLKILISCGIPDDKARQYEALFNQNDIDAQMLDQLDDALLEKIGIVSIGHRLKLTNYIKALIARNSTKSPRARARLLTPARADSRSSIMIPSNISTNSHNSSNGSGSGSGGSVSEGEGASTSGRNSNSVATVLKSNTAHNVFVKDIQIQHRLGDGNFGDVYQGKWQGRTPVALKKLSGDKLADQFVGEVQLLMNLRHPNIVTCFGVFSSTDAVENYIVFELLPLKDLKRFLQSHRSVISFSQIVNMAKDVAAGMVYLADNNIIHRDLAARNLLVKKETDGKYTVKVSDFGLSRMTDQDSDYYSSKGSLFPLKWTAPEALKYRQFSLKSDVWSYGIVLYELITYGEDPYPSLTNQEAVERVLGGYRIPCPSNCPKPFYELMTKCWAEDPKDRPTFSEILGLLSTIN